MMGGSSLRTAAVRACFAVALAAAVLASGCGHAGTVQGTASDSGLLPGIPEWDGSAPSIELSESPSLTENDAEGVVEEYADLDELGRCGQAVAIVSLDTMPEEGEERGEIGMVRPSGWHTVRYDDLVDGMYLYNRCHLIGWQLAGENANERNLITGTRWMNVEGMLPYENMVADYVRATGGRVLYRVTPIFQGDELVARGVRMEALSLGDGGKGLSFDVFCYNVQPGIEIDYMTGESSRADDDPDTKDGAICELCSESTQ